MWQRRVEKATYPSATGTDQGARGPVEQTANYVQLFDANIRTFFREGLRVARRDPGMVAFLLRTLLRQRKAARTRGSWARRGVHVPPFMIASITNRCNLNCKGCYAKAHHRQPTPELSPGRLGEVFSEAQDLGISIILLAGGEPLTRPEILDITAQTPKVVFPLFTNGLLIDKTVVDALREQRNVVPVLSIEGHETETDDRRGEGVYRHLTAVMDKLRAAGVFFGTSTTITSQNMGAVLAGAYVRELYERGCRLFFFIEYVPVQPGTECLELDEEQRQRALARIDALRRDVPALFAAFPGDEAMYGGCLAAGRGFVHLGASGSLEPCPFSPYSDVSLADTSLVEALQSPLLRTIRESDVELAETTGGCALWERRDWVASLLT